jgi:hypothetical protein
MTYRPSSIATSNGLTVTRAGQRSNRFICLTRLSFATLIALTGSLGLSQATWAEGTSDRGLLAQSIVDGLPPSPAFSGEQLPPPQLQPSQSPQFVTTPANPEFQPSPDPYSVDSAGAQRYLVLVNGDSPLLLEQVRKVESGAFLQNYDGRRVIQAGSFIEPNRAQQQQQVLESQGIGAEVIAIASAGSTQANSYQQNFNQTAVAYNTTVAPPELVPATTTNREVVFGQQPNFNSGDVRIADTSLVAVASSRYYVVVPGGRAELTAINDQVTRLGGGLGIARAVNERTSPLGPHIIVGPYVNRRAAERWSRYLRTFGMDARVYYRR